LGDNKKGRLVRYFWKSVLNSKKRGKSLIYKALIKYGHSAFILGILEYCLVTNLKERENYYIKLFKPEYNILQEAYSSTKFKHSLLSIEKMKGPRPYYSPSTSHRKAISIAHKNKNVSTETKKRISLSLSLPIYVYDSRNKSLLHFFPTIVEAKNTLKMSTKTIHKYLNNKMPYKGILFSKSLMF
jgi:group I intron endonuclease